MDTRTTQKKEEFQNEPTRKEIEEMLERQYKQLDKPVLQPSFLSYMFSSCFNRESSADDQLETEISSERYRPGHD